MSSVGGMLKVLCLCGVMAGVGMAQKASPAAGKPAEVRPAIFQRGSSAVQIVASSKTAPQLSTTAFHVASNEEVDGMEHTLEQYVTAFERLSLPDVKQVWPELDQKHTKAFKDVFAAFKGMAAPPRLGLTCEIPKVTEGTADVQCMETVTYEISKGKKKEAGPARVSILLKGQAGNWVVLDMKGLG